MDTSINSTTQLYALVGYPIKHSISPAIHNSLFARQSHNSRYVLLKIPPEKLAAAVTVLRSSFSGWNVTVPHKQAIMPYLDEIDERARMYGAVNTVKNVAGRLIGYNTDGYGFIKAFERFGIAVHGNKVLMVGAGGGARSALYNLLERRCHVTIVNRTRMRAEQLQREFSPHLPGRVEVKDWHELDDSYEFLIQTTPQGMYPAVEHTPFPYETLARFSNLRVVYDLIYNPAATRLLTDAKRLGCQVVNGYPMLYYQALAANNIWTGEPVPSAVEEELYGKIERYLQSME